MSEWNVGFVKLIILNILWVAKIMDGVNSRTTLEEKNMQNQDYNPPSIKKRHKVKQS